MRTLLLFVPMAIVLGGLTFSTIAYRSNGPRDYLQTFSSGPYGNGIIGFYPGVFGQDNLESLLLKENADLLLSTEPNFVTKSLEIQYTIL